MDPTQLDRAVEDRQPHPVVIPCGAGLLKGDLVMPCDARGIVVFAHGSGSSRHSVRNRFVAEALQAARFGTLLMDLLTEHEEQREREHDARLRFDIELLAERLASAANLLKTSPATRALPMAYFGASTGAAAALVAAAEWPPTDIAAVVSRGGRPDLAGHEVLAKVRAPTLLIVGSLDRDVLKLNRAAQAELRCESSLHVVSRASHLFEEPGALEEATFHAREWFSRFMPVGEGSST